ncbi:MAG TPA: DUF1707 domain-containing protein [Gaiellales bacterium]|jgi:hypothetical protein
MDESTLASTADRDRVVARLAEAHVDGRLSVDELDELTGRAHAARTLADLEVVTTGLPRLPTPVDAGGGAVVASPGPYSGGQIAGMTALTIVVPMGRLIGLVTALSLMRGEQLPERRRMLRTWATVCAVLLTIEVIAILVFVVGL